MAGTGSRLHVLGAGPIGLAAALAGQRSGWDVAVYERGDRVAAHIRGWGHVRLFTPWSMNLPAAAGDALPGPDDCPTGHEYADHLERIALALPGLHLKTRVDRVGREGLLESEEIATERRRGTPFRVLLTGPDSCQRVEHADAALGCRGTYGQPHPTGSGGIPAPGEKELAERIMRSIHEITAAWADRRVLLVGADKSAQTTARDLAAIGAHLVWAVRATAPTWGAIPDDPLPERAALVSLAHTIAAGVVPNAELVTGVSVQAIGATADGVSVTLGDGNGRARDVSVEVVVSLTGSVGDHYLYRRVQVHECYATEGPMALAAALLGAAGGDCLTQRSAGIAASRNPEPGYLILGAKSSGRTNTFLLRVGFEQVQEVLDALDAERAEAATAIRVSA